MRGDKFDDLARQLRREEMKRLLRWLGDSVAVVQRRLAATGRRWACLVPPRHI